MTTQPMTTQPAAAGAPSPSPRPAAAGAPPEAQVVDARGLACPLPALRLACAVRTGGPGRYLLLADDPAAGRDIPLLAAERGWQVVAAEAAAGRYLVEAPG